MIFPWSLVFLFLSNCIVYLYPLILSILKWFYTRATNTCEIPHRSNTNFNSKEISVSVRNLQETKLQIWRNLLAQKPRETERTHLRYVTILHVWYFLDNITSDKKKRKKNDRTWRVTFAQKISKEGEKKKEIDKKTTRKKRINVTITLFVFFFFITIRFITSTNFTWYGKKYKDIKEKK